MRIRPTATLAAATASLVILAGVTYAAVQSVDPNPDAQVVIPSLHTASPHPSRGGQHSREHGKADAAAHDSADDHGAGSRRSGNRSAEPGDDRGGGGSGHDRDKADPGGGEPSSGGHAGGKPGPTPAPDGGGDKGGGHGGGHDGD